MTGFRQNVSALFTNKAHAGGLSVFRMLYALLLMLEAWKYFQVREVVFSKVPFGYVGELDYGLIFVFWMLSLLLLFVGYRTRLAKWTGYVLGVIVFSSAVRFEYHIFYTYLGVNTLLLFLPVSRVWSLDAWLQRRKGLAVSTQVPILYYLLPVYAGIALVYFDSIFLKLQNHLWTSGLGVWLPSSIPMVAWHDMTFLLNQKWLMYFLGYFVLAFEASVIVLLWFRRWRVPVMIIGALFHLGILVAYPIPLFALTYVVIYLLLAPADWWRRLAAAVGRPLWNLVPSGWKDLVGRLPVDRDLESELPMRAWKVIIPGLLVLQCLFILHLMPSVIGQPLKKFTGITRHDVFLDFHFANYDHELKVAYRAPDGSRTLVPLISEDGMPCGYTTGIIWRNLSFNVVTQNLIQRRIEENYVPYLRLFLKDRGIQDPAPLFEFEIRTTDIPTVWEKDFLKRQLEKPWQPAGTCVLGSQVPVYEWTPEMIALFTAESPAKSTRP